MRLGLIARCDDRGLGTMTRAFHEHMRPARTLVVIPTGTGFVQHPEWYEGSGDVTFVEWKPGGPLPEDVVCGFLDGLDALYSAETMYDWRILAWCRERNVRSVLHAMPEFFDYRRTGADLPDAVWNPTTWRHSTLPPGSVVVPVPAEVAPFHREPAEMLRVVHVAGNRAMADRNGTTAMIRALRLVRHPVRVRFECQAGACPAPQRVPSHVEVEMVRGGRADRWDMYRDADLLVMPRRYGGLCLPVHEALACGLQVMLPLVEPNKTWPGLFVAGRPASHITTAAGRITVYDTPPGDIARMLDVVAHPGPSWSVAPDEWWKENSWDALASVYREAFAKVCS